MRWEGHRFVIHPTPSTGYNFKYPAQTGRWVLKHCPVNPWTLSSFSSFWTEPVTWYMWYVEEQAQCFRCLLECYHQGNWCSNTLMISRWREWNVWTTVKTNRVHQAPLSVRWLNWNDALWCLSDFFWTKRLLSSLPLLLFFFFKQYKNL